MKKLGCISLLVAVSCLSLAQQAPHHATPPAQGLLLKDGWSLQATARVDEGGAVISTPKFLPKGWHSASVPTTVVAALVKEKKYPDPFFGMNLRTYPGVTYPIGGNFSNIAMAPDSPYAVSWWYRKPFTVPASYKGKSIWLKFNGINYRANVWLNGKQIAKDDDVAGAWRTYEFNITDAAKPGAENVLAVGMPSQYSSPGSISDALSGIASVTCNGSGATVQSGTFTCAITLSAGSNSIAVQATDVAGNTSTQSISVNLITPASITGFTPGSAPIGTLKQFRVPTRNSSPLDITQGSDGNFWFTEGFVNPPQMRERVDEMQVVQPVLLCIGLLENLKSLGVLPLPVVVLCDYPPPPGRRRPGPSPAPC